MTKKSLIYICLIFVLSGIVLSFTVPTSQMIKDIARAIGEVIQYTTSNSLRVVLPSNYPYPHARDGGSSNIITGDTCTTMVFEYGDGTFTTNFTSTHNYNPAPNGNLFVSLTRYYDTTDMPDLYSRNTTGITLSGLPNNNTPFLSQNQSFDLVPHVGTIVPHDTTHFIIPFKNTNSLFICFYNNEGARFFGSIPDPNSSMNINGLNIPFIRVHNGQKVYTNVDQIPSTLFSGYSAQAASLVSYINAQQNSGLRFSDYFIIYNSNDTPRFVEKNMFFSLPPISNYLIPGLDNNVTTVRLVKYDINANKDKPANNITVDKNLQYVARPRDPNNILVNPGCLSSKGATHMVTINFQNLGLGVVQNQIILKTTMPHEVMQSVNPSEIVLGSVSIPIGNILNGTSSHKIERKISGVSGVPDTLILTLKSPPSNPPETSKPLLKGLTGSAFGALDPATMGHFKFAVKPGLAAAKMPYLFETNIYFDSESPVYTYYKMDKCKCMPKALKAIVKAN